MNSSRFVTFVTLSERIQSLRTAGQTIAAIRAPVASDVGSVASSFGLSAEADCYHTIDRAEAVRAVAAILHRDLAYGIELMPLETAQDLAQRFVQIFAAHESQFYTNGDWGRVTDPRAGVSWRPATDATFDGGVLVLSPELAGCVWCCDED
jgi:hypothetical protein